MSRTTSTPIRQRAAHLVGSTPFSDTDEALDIMFDRLGPYLETVPDGETGPRQNWIQGLVDSFRQHPDLEPARAGDWSDYDRTPTVHVRRGHRFVSSRLDLGYLRHFEESWPAYQKRRAAANGALRSGLRFQIGIPGDLDLAVFSFGNPIVGLRHRSVFRNATLRDIRAVHARAGDEVVFQLEVPFELIVLTQLPTPLVGPVAAFFARGISRLVEGAPAGSHWGIHLCLGDMNHRAMGRLDDVRRIVSLSNAIVDRWPAGRHLDFMHVPLAAAAEPPPADLAFYAPLREVRLPEGTRFVGGFVHEDRTLTEQRALLGELDRLIGRPVDLGCSCGLGRRDAQAALATIDRAAALCGATAVTTPGRSARRKGAPRPRSAPAARTTP